MSDRASMGGDVNNYEGWQIGVSIIVGIVVTALALWWASGFSVSYEMIFRINPAYQGSLRGVGTSFVMGNTNSALHILITLVHIADVIMGLFLLFLVIVHWSAFRRFADRMRGTEEPRERTAVADGGSTEGERR